jgi:hypothetical protein
MVGISDGESLESVTFMASWTEKRWNEAWKLEISFYASSAWQRVGKIEASNMLRLVHFSRMVNVQDSNIDDE